MNPSDQTLEVQKLFVDQLPELRRFVLSLLPNRSEADDVVQEVFLAVTTKANDFVLGSNFKAWAFAIARFKVLESLRRAKQDPHVLTDSVIEKLAEETEDTDPEQESLVLKALTKCIEKLAPKPKLAIELQYREKCKPADIADRLGWEANSVYVTLSRARSDLKNCVQKSIA